jgi:hypothetical protein
MLVLVVPGLSQKLKREFKKHTLNLTFKNRSSPFFSQSREQIATGKFSRVCKIMEYLTLKK